MSHHNIFQYKDPLQFLIDRFNARKESDPKFSVRQWAQEMGLKSPVILAAILDGKRPMRVQFYDFLQCGLNLDEEESLFFKILILKRSARSEAETQIFDSMLLRMKPSREFSAIYSDSESIFDHWSMMAILSASGTTNTPMTQSRVAQLFADRLSAQEVEAGITKLKSEGLLLEDEKGVLRPTHQRVSSKNGEDNAGAKRYFSQVLHMAQDAISLPLAKREIQSFSLRIPETKLSLARDLIRDVRTRLDALEDEEGDQIFQVHLQMFPLSSQNVEAVSL